MLSTATLTCLTCGSNGTGLSAMVSLEKAIGFSDEKLLLSRCLLNVGDSTQRFCGENRIKLNRVSCIILTSLAPHNASGLPGILLCSSDLGLGKITICGPPGLKMLLDLMAPFTNRKYPELVVIEVGDTCETVNLEFFTLKLMPIWAIHPGTGMRTGSPVAISATILPCLPTVMLPKSSSTLPVSSSDRTFYGHKGVCVIPTDLTFNCTPSKGKLLKLATERDSCKIALFAPISAASIGICDGKHKHLMNEEKNLRRICLKAKIAGVLMHVRKQQYTS